MDAALLSLLKKGARLHLEAIAACNARGEQPTLADINRELRRSPRDPGYTYGVLRALLDAHLIVRIRPPGSRADRYTIAALPAGRACPTCPYLTHLHTYLTALLQTGN